MNNDGIETSRLARLLDELRTVSTHDHIPEDILRAYLAETEIDEAVEKHLVGCATCQDLADTILAQTSPWKDDAEHIEELKAQVLFRAESGSSGFARRLQMALEAIALTRDDLRSRLVSWRDGVVHGYLGAEATIQTDFSIHKVLSVLEDLGGPQVTFAYIADGPGVRGAGDASSQPKVARSAVGLSTGKLVAAQVTIKEDALEVIFLHWNWPAPPLVVLVPESGAVGAQATVGTADIDTDVFTARFEGIGHGIFILTIADPDA